MRCTLEIVLQIGGKNVYIYPIYIRFVGIEIAFLTLAVEAIINTLIGSGTEKLTDKLISKLKGDPSKKAFQQALASAINRYATTSERKLRARPLLDERGLFTETEVAREVAKLFQFRSEPNFELIGDRWKKLLEAPPIYVNFSDEAQELLNYIEVELRNTEVFRPVFDSKSLDAIAANATISVEKLSEMNSRLEKIYDIVDTRFGKLTQLFGGASENIHNSIRDYGSYIEEKTQNFVGREFVMQAIEDFMQHNPRGYFLIRGDPGIGKTAIAAQIVKQNGYVHHFNIRAQGINSADTFLRNICAQLIARYELGYESLPVEATQDSGFFTKLLNEISDKLPSDKKAIIVIDALDEVDDAGLPAGVNTLYLPTILPERVYVIVTMRNVPISIRIEIEKQTLDIEQDSEHNIADIHEYLEKKCGSEGICTFAASQNKSAQEFIDVMIRKSQGNFMYLHYVLPEIEQGNYKDLGLDAIPEGLQNYYEQHWELMKGKAGGDWPKYKLPVLVGLTIYKKPVSIEFIAKHSKVKERVAIRNVLEEWKQFLHEEDVKEDKNVQKRYRIYHASFHDFITSRQEVRDQKADFEAEDVLIDSFLPKDYGH